MGQSRTAAATHGSAAAGWVSTWVRCLIAAVVAIGMVACSDTVDADRGTHATGSPVSSTQAPATASADDNLRLVSLGDSISTNNQCPGCSTFADLYGRSAEGATGKSVVVQNLSEPDTQAADLLDQVTRDQKTRHALTGANIVTVTIGYNDTPWNRLDDPCKAAPDYPAIQWRKITPRCTERVMQEFANILDRVLATIVKLHGATPLVLRVTTVYNSVLGDTVDPTWDSPQAVGPSRLANRQFAAVQCRLATKYGGTCAEMIPLINGADGANDAGPYLAADHTHLSQQGHQLTAEALTALGFPPAA